MGACGAVHLSWHRRALSPLTHKDAYLHSNPNFQPLDGPCDETKFIPDLSPGEKKIAHTKTIPMTHKLNNNKFQIYLENKFDILYFFLLT